MKQHTTRAYNQFVIDENQGILYKKSSQQRLAEEIEYYTSLPEKIRHFFPRVLYSSTEQNDNILGLEYYSYQNLGDYLLGTTNIKEIASVVAKIRYILELFSSLKNYIDISDACSWMYITKTIKYLNELREQDKFKTLTTAPNLNINGILYNNFDNLLPKIKDHISNMLKNGCQASIIHGDLCFSNILVGVNSNTGIPIVKLIDPRGKFGQSKMYGDRRYDYAKLMHSYEGRYEDIINDRFCIDGDNGTYNYEFTYHSNPNIVSLFKAQLPFPENDIRLIQGLIFIGMCSRHYDSESRQKLMYLTGIKLLNESL